MDRRLIVFDFDGTLVDTRSTILASYASAIRALGLEARTAAQCQATIGVPLREGFRQLYPGQTEEGLDACVAAYRAAFDANKALCGPTPFPTVVDTLRALYASGWMLSVATSRSHASLVAFMEDHGLTDLFALLVAADDVARAKPDPEPVLHTLRTLRVAAARTLVVGDMPVDIAMGRGAGCDTVGVTYGNSDRAALAAAGAGHIIGQMSELLQIAL